MNEKRAVIVVGSGDCGKALKKAMTRIMLQQMAVEYITEDEYMNRQPVRKLQLTKFYEPSFTLKEDQPEYYQKPRGKKGRNRKWQRR